MEEPYIQVYRTTKGEESTQEQIGVQTKERQREVVKVQGSISGKRIRSKARY